MTRFESLTKIFPTKMIYYVLFTSIIIPVLLSIPLFYWYQHAPAGMVFLGVYQYDEFYYGGWSHEASETAGFFFANPYDASSDSPRVYYYLFFNLLGKIMLITGIPFIPLWQASRIILGSIMFLIIYKFMKYIFPDNEKKVLISFTLAAWSSGWSWMLFLAFLAIYRFDFPDAYIHYKEISRFYDWWMPSHFTLTLYPHWVFPFSLALLSLYYWLRGTNETELKFIFISAGFSLLTWGSHYFTALALTTIIFMHTVLSALINRRILWKEVIAIVCTVLPPLAYNAYIVRKFESVAIVVHQFRRLVFIIPLYDYLFAWGLLLVLAVPGGYLYLRKKTNQSIFFVAWVIGVFILLNHYFITPLLGLTYPFQPAHYADTFAFPLSVLSTEGIYFLYKKMISSKSFSQSIMRPKRAKQILVILFLTTIPSNFVFMVDLYQEPTYYAFIYKEEVDAFKWLDDNTEDFDVVLCLKKAGYLIPVFTGNKVLYGHDALTPFNDERDHTTQRFFDGGTSETERVEIIQQYQVKYIYYGPWESDKGFDPENSAYLREVYTNARVIIYEVLV
ncbi:MAG: hypothetical protein ACFFCD_09055 [Promethearchaeota archaeon]